MAAARAIAVSASIHQIPLSPNGSGHDLRERNAEGTDGHDGEHGVEGVARRR